MSVRVSTWVWHETTAKGNDRLMLLALADNANDDGWCWPGVAQLVDKTMLGRSTVIRRLDVLEAAGLVERYTRADAGRTTVYRVAVPWADAGSWPAELGPHPGGSQFGTPGGSHRRDGGVPQAGRGGSHGRDTEPSLNRHEPSAAGRPPRRKPERPLPEDWKPTAKHAALASERGVDLSSEAFRFRAHAAANDRRQRDWDAAFAMWLSKARPEQGPRSTWSRAVEVGSPEWHAQRGDR